MTKRLLAVATIGFLGAALALAQEDDDPPSRAARLSYLAGSVSFQPGSVEDWVPATLNRPMTTGDRLWTEAGGRAEMHLGSAALRVNGRTNFAFLDLDDRTVQVQLSVGTLNVRLRNLANDEIFEIDTPQLALTLVRAGEYRVDVDENGEATIVSVRGGEADATADSDAITVRARDQVRASGTDRVVFDRRNVPPADNFDNFCENRDRREDMSQSARYVSRDIPGYEDLDRAGVWREAGEYGMVWYPSGMQAGWAPYREGHWAWISPWGWTWVDDAPWGYAPFHYGRWVYAGGGWGWVPGPLGPRPVYAPAMVAWVGGGGFSVGIGVGPAVGWFALGPREVWVPSYRHSSGYIERVNVTNTVIVNRTVINNVNVNNVNYVNRNVAGAVTVMPRDQMVSGRPVRGAGVPATPQMMANARIENNSAVAPDRRAVLGGRQPGAGSSAPPPSVSNRQIMTRRAPPPAPVSFAQQQQRLQENPGQPIPRSVVQTPQGPQGGGQPGGGQGGQSPRPTFRQVGPRNGNQGGGQGQGGGRPGGGPGFNGQTPAPTPNAVTPNPGPGPGTPQDRRREGPTAIVPGPGPGGPQPQQPGRTPPQDRRVQAPAPGAPPAPTPAPTPQPPQAPNTIVPLRPGGGPGPGNGGPQERRGQPPETRAAPPAPAPTPAPQAVPQAPGGGGGGNQKQKGDGKRRPPEKDDKGKDK